MYDGEFSYIDVAENGYGISHSDRSGMFERMRECGITAFIEAATSFKRHEEQRALDAKYRGFAYFSAGLHPKECALVPLKHRKKLRENASELSAIAIGETGLDYSMPRKEQHRLRQKLWFAYQLKLADELKLPLILHVRDADNDALKILQKHKAILHGGVAHCFHGDLGTASEYIALGFTLGIGSKLLEDNAEMHDAIRSVPLSSIIVETDAPYLRPDISQVNASNRQKKKARNSSLILPSVITKIAELRCEDRDAVEKAIYENTLRAFHLTEAGE
jgi:TatD DNase family protein